MKFLDIFLLFTAFITGYMPVITAKELYIVPDSPHSMPLHLYQEYSSRPSSQISYWQLLGRALHPFQYNIKTTDLSELLDPQKFSKSLKQADRILCVNVPVWTSKNWKKNLLKLPKNKLILIAFEPPSVMPYMYQSNTLNLFGKVLTWDDSLVDNVRFFKFYYPVLKSMRRNLPAFKEKKLLTQISANKRSSHPHQLYSARREVIDYFEKRDGGKYFDFYGIGWKKKNYRTYKGVVQDKIETLKKYRFSTCYENISHTKGYITEKIFDCFEAGVVPIYLGASNVKEYIPANCFIAREDFATFDTLIYYIKNMTEKEYNQYLSNIRAFLQSPAAYKFSVENFAKTIAQAL